MKILQYPKTIVCVTLGISFTLFIAIYYTLSLEKFVLVKASYTRLSHWDRDHHLQAFEAFKNSCVEILKREPTAAFGNHPQFGLVRDWQAICKAANKIQHPNNLNTKQFFEQWFTPYAVKNNFNPDGLFTGYYLPLLQGSLKKEGKYTIPIYGPPKDLVKINLRAFYPDLPSKSINGQLKNQYLVPYPDRAAINSGAIQNTAPVLLWGSDLIDLFFAQIQGSAVVQLPEGKQILIGYAGQNGRPYTAIGRVISEQYGLDKKTITMQVIRDWLHKHPDLVHTILNRNASYVFFRFLTTNDPIGTEQIPLTQRRSLAVDTRYIPLGAPLWVDTKVIQPHSTTERLPYKHLLIAQDTGGSIKGIIRGDIYWGVGEDAAFIAGHLNSRGKYWILLPRSTI